MRIERKPIGRDAISRSQIPSYSIIPERVSASRAKDNYLAGLAAREIDRAGGELKERQKHQNMLQRKALGSAPIGLIIHADWISTFASDTMRCGKHRRRPSLKHVSLPRCRQATWLDLSVVAP